MDGATWPDRPTRMTTKTQTPLKMDRSTRDPCVGTITDFHRATRMDCLVGKARTTRVARLEVLHTPMPTWMASLPSRHSILRSQGGRQATPIPNTGRNIGRNPIQSGVRPTTAGRLNMETSRHGAGSFASQADKSRMGELERLTPFRF